MSAQGSVIARVYTSDAYIPLAQVPVTFTQVLPEGGRRLLAIRRTDSSGLTKPLFVDTPELAESQHPGSTIRPYATLDIQVEYPGYGGILVEGVQVFPSVETIQGLQLRPLPSASTEGDQVTYPGSSQNL